MGHSIFKLQDFGEVFIQISYFDRGGGNDAQRVELLKTIPLMKTYLLKKNVIHITNKLAAELEELGSPSWFHFS